MQKNNVIWLLVLDEPIGNEIGWYGLLSAPDQYLQKQIVNITGYPGEEDKKHHMYTMQGLMQPVNNQKGYDIHHDIDTTGGQSGSGIWIKKEDEPYVIGVHTAGDQGQVEKNRKNYGVRLSNSKFEKLIQWISEIH